MNKLVTTTAVAGVALAMSAVTALGGTGYQQQKPSINLSCQPGKLTIVNRTPQVIRIKLRKGRYLSLLPNYQVPVTKGRIQIRKVNMLGTGLFSVRVGQKWNRYNKFWCKIPKSCFGTLNYQKTGKVNNRSISCKHHMKGFF